MTPIDPLERHLPDGLADLANPRVPSYLNDILADTGRARQRPAWSFLERWLPMALIERRPATAPPLRAAWVLLLAALLVLTIAASSLIAGARLITSMLPNDTSTNLSVAPAYGAARNGLVAYETLDGDVNVVRPWDRHRFEPSSEVPTTTSTPSGPRMAPAWRSCRCLRAGWHGADGRQRRRQRHPAAHRRSFAPDSTGPFLWSPDGRHIAFDRLVNGVRTLRLARTDGSGVKTLDTGMASELAAWKPPLGDQRPVPRHEPRIPSGSTASLFRGRRPWWCPAP